MSLDKLTLHTSDTFWHMCHLVLQVARPLTAQTWNGPIVPNFRYLFVFMARSMLEIYVNWLWGQVLLNRTAFSTCLYL